MQLAEIVPISHWLYSSLTILFSLNSQGLGKGVSFLLSWWSGILLSCSLTVTTHKIPQLPHHMYSKLKENTESEVLVCWNIQLSTAGFICLPFSFCRCDKAGGILRFLTYLVSIPKPGPPRPSRERALSACSRAPAPPRSWLLFPLPGSGVCEAHSLLPDLMSSGLTSFWLAPPCLWPSMPLTTLSPVSKRFSFPESFPGHTALESLHTLVFQTGSSVTSKLNKHENNVGNWQEAAKCWFRQAGRQKQEMPSIITIILLKKGILTVKMGKGHRLRKIKMFLKEQWVSKLEGKARRSRVVRKQPFLFVQYREPS